MNHYPTLIIVFSSFLLTSHFSHAEKQLDAIQVNAPINQGGIESSGFNVDVVSTDEYLNTTKNITQLLNQTPGINVRENGGLGSSYDLSLNGLSGDQVRYFLDGIPMENFGSSMGLNNMPVNLVENVEVFKGVVPISLGADALAGAVNIVTPNLNQDLLDLSYSYGSFNTNRLALVGQTSNYNGYFLRASGYYNYSDNNYTMSSVPNTDNLGNVLGNISVERFNDQYKSKMLTFKIGRTDFSWADELSINLTYADNQDNQQHPSTSTNIVFGEVYSRSKTTLWSGIYKKKNDRFSIKSYVLSGDMTETFYDTVSRSYDWSGNYVDKPTETQGELGNRSVFELNDKVLRLNLSGEYYYSDQSILSLNISSNYLDRDGEDSIDTVNNNFTLPNSVNKNVLGVSYSRLLFDESLNTNAFIKYYDYYAEIGARQVVNGVDQDVQSKSQLSNTGYGFSANYTISDTSEIKVSYEKAYRLPEPDEILGSGQYIRANPNLNSEVSNNINLGFINQFLISDYYIKNEINGFYRDAKDFISYVPDRIITGIYKNTSLVAVTGIETALEVNWNQKISLKINATYQDIIDKTQMLDNGDKNLGYGDRLPNKPYLYANLRTGYTHITDSYNSISAHWSSHFVERYFLYSQSSGSEDFNRDIPTQITHDFDTEYSIRNGEYNVAFNITNIFDEEIYDNYNIQKPGRAFYIKLRYVQ
jgi:outer membrane cobalamin receptor